MPTRTEKVVGVAVRAATKAKQWAQAAVREADRLMHEAKRRAESEDRRRRLKQTLLKTGRVLKTAGRAGVVAPVAPGVPGPGHTPPTKKSTDAANRPKQELQRGGAPLTLPQW